MPDTVSNEKSHSLRKNTQIQLLKPANLLHVCCSVYVINLMKLCGLKAGVSLYRCVNIIHAGFILTLKGEVFSGI